MDKIIDFYLHIGSDLLYLNNLVLNIAKASFAQNYCALHQQRILLMMTSLEVTLDDSLEGHPVEYLDYVENVPDLDEN